MNQQFELYGELQELSDAGKQSEFLNLQFNPSSISLKERWRNNGLSADFMADYVTTFFPQIENQPETSERQAEIKSVVAFVANELLENGMKYSSTNSQHLISISLHLLEKAIVITEVNPTSAVQAQQYKNFIELIDKSDPMELYLQQLEAKAMEEEASGLGFLTMLNDYAAELAWKFSVQDNEQTLVTTQVTVPI